jgi:acyl-CoA thioester hydrolase
MTPAKQQVLQSLKTIRFQDCDPFNHLNNGRYFDYFMNAREDQLIENYDLDIYKIAKETGLSWVVASSKIAFIKPAFLMETVLIETQMIAYSERDILVEMRMYDETKTQLKSVLWSNFVHFNLQSQKSDKHSDAYLLLFEEVCLPVAEKNFDERHLKLMGK